MTDIIDHLKFPIGLLSLIRKVTLTNELKISRTFSALKFVLKENCKIMNNHIYRRKKRITPHFLIQENIV